MKIFFSKSCFIYKILSFESTFKKKISQKLALMTHTHSHYLFHLTNTLIFSVGVSVRPKTDGGNTNSKVESKVNCRNYSFNILCRSIYVPFCRTPKCHCQILERRNPQHLLQMDLIVSTILYFEV